jgi:hypothetical protein
MGVKFTPRFQFGMCHHFCFRKESTSGKHYLKSSKWGLYLIIEPNAWDFYRLTRYRTRVFQCPGNQPPRDFEERERGLGPIKTRFPAILPAVVPNGRTDGIWCRHFIPGIRRICGSGGTVYCRVSVQSDRNVARSFFDTGISMSS